MLVEREAEVKILKREREEVLTQKVEIILENKALKVRKVGTYLGYLD